MYRGRETDGDRCDVTQKQKVPPVMPISRKQSFWTFQSIAAQINFSFLLFVNSFRTIMMINGQDKDKVNLTGRWVGFSGSFTTTWLETAQSKPEWEELSHSRNDDCKQNTTLLINFPEQKWKKGVTVLTKEQQTWSGTFSEEFEVSEENGVQLPSTFFNSRQARSKAYSKLTNRGN